MLIVCCHIQKPCIVCRFSKSPLLQIPQRNIGLWIPALALRYLVQHNRRNVGLSPIEKQELLNQTDMWMRLEQKRDLQSFALPPSRRHRRWLCSLFTSRFGITSSAATGDHICSVSKRPQETFGLLDARVTSAVVHFIWKSS